MTVRGYARHRGVAHTSVLQAIKTGRIKRRKDGKIDSEAADRAWKERTDQSKPRNSVSGRPKHRRGKNAPPAPVSYQNGGNGKDQEEDDDAPRRGTWASARIEREQVLAELEKLKLGQVTGKLVDADQVRGAAFEAGRRARDILMSIPARISPIVAPISDEAEVFQVLEGHIREVCEEISRAMKDVGNPRSRAARRARRQ